MDLQAEWERAIRYSDINCAARFARGHADDLRYDHPLRAWFARTNGEWVRCGRSDLVRMSVRFLTLLANEAHVQEMRESGNLRRADALVDRLCSARMINTVISHSHSHLAI